MDQSTKQPPQSSEPDDVMLPAIEQTGQAAPVGSPAANLQFSDPLAQAQTGVSQGGAQPMVAVPDEAADNELIEKEWVVKAKQIIESTGHDPYLQQEEIAKMKADYVKKRYNKDIAT